jgi:hypothetical protein
VSGGPWKTGGLPDTEKRIQQRIMLLLRAAGFRVFNLSQARATNQSPGLPDLLLMHPVLGVEATFEVKAPKGRVSAPQQEFSDLREKCGRRHLIGGYDVVETWLLELGLLHEIHGQMILTPRRTA